MTHSPLATGRLKHQNKRSDRRGLTPRRVIVHHWAGTSGAFSRFEDPRANVSTNYAIDNDGNIFVQVDEEYRAWTSGSFDADGPSITVEVANSKVGGDWPVSKKAYVALCNLIADVAKRYGWGSVDASRVRGHREFSATACPGPYLWERLGDIRHAAHTILKGSGPSTPRPGNTKPAAEPTWAFNKPDAQLQLRVQRALAGRKPSRYTGPQDGVWGVNTIKGIQTTIRGVGYDGPIDGVPGPLTCRLVQEYAKKFGDYKGPVDGILGKFSWQGFALGLERP